MEAEGHGGQSQDPAHQQPSAVGSTGHPAQLQPVGSQRAISPLTHSLDFCLGKLSF